MEEVVVVLVVGAVAVVVLVVSTCTYIGRTNTRAVHHNLVKPAELVLHATHVDGLG